MGCGLGIFSWKDEWVTSRNPSGVRNHIHRSSARMDSDDSRLHLLRRRWAGALAVTALCTQYASILMSQPTSEKAQWNDTEVVQLLDFLFTHRAEAGEGTNFKNKTFNGAATHVVPYLTHGPPKTAKRCKTKWASVCGFVFESDRSTTDPFHS